MILLISDTWFVTWHDNVPVSYWFDPLKARVETLIKFGSFLGKFEDTEINWLLQLSKEEIELMKNSKIWKANIQAQRNGFVVGWDKDKILDTFPEDVCMSKHLIFRRKGQKCFNLHGMFSQKLLFIYLQK